MLRKTRIVLAAIFFVGITLLFVGIGEQWWGWMAKLQFLPSCLALNMGVIAGIVILTLLFGRIYCSIICPLGVFQDCINALSASRKGKKRRFKFHKEARAVRDFVLALVLLALMFDVQWFVALIAPYSAYGRIVRTIIDPSSWTAFAVAGGTLLVIFVFAWFWGREWCSSVCPVGTVLSLLGRFSMFKPVIDEDKCVHCGSCGKKCKASCIDTFNREIDYSRCVDCFDCIEDCKAGAIKYRFAWKKNSFEQTPESNSTAAGSPASKSRRAFISGLALLGGAAGLKAQEAVDPLAGTTLGDIEPKQNPERSCRLVPPGAGSQADFYSRCTACGLCISVCPNHVLRPSTDLEHLMQPQMGFEKGFCRPECTECSKVCPSGAILEIVPEQKSQISIGHARIDENACLAYNSNTSCGNCARHCPSGAVRMVEIDGKEVPVVHKHQCIGCGECEYLCPVRPISAITVNGLATHKIL